MSTETVQESEATAELMTAEYLMEIARDGDEHGWPTELRLLWTDMRDDTLAVMDRVLGEGFLQPVEIGPDGRVWNGHHRIAVAAALGIMVPVVRLKEPADV